MAGLEEARRPTPNRHSRRRRSRGPGSWRERYARRSFEAAPPATGAEAGVRPSRSAGRWRPRATRPSERAGGAGRRPRPARPSALASSRRGRQHLLEPLDQPLRRPRSRGRSPARASRSSVRPFDRRPRSSATRASPTTAIALRGSRLGDLRGRASRPGRAGRPTARARPGAAARSSVVRPRRSRARSRSVGAVVERRVRDHPLEQVVEDPSERGPRREPELGHQVVAVDRQARDGRGRRPRRAPPRSARGTRRARAPAGNAGADVVGLAQRSSSSSALAARSCR